MKKYIKSSDVRFSDLESIVLKYYDPDSWADIAGTDDFEEIRAEDISGYENFEHVMWMVVKYPYWRVSELPNPIELVDTPKGLRAVQVGNLSMTVDDVTDDIIQYHVNMPY